VFELLSEKFQLFEGVFGASDEVLGAIESGVDFEKRIGDIYQRCRKHEEIKVAFDQLQLELSLEINEAMTQTSRKLLENFDDEVRDKLKVRADASVASLNRIERYLMRLTAHELHAHADFLSEDSFRLKSSPFPDAIPLGIYELPRRSGEAHLYRLHHPLAEAIIARAKGRELPVQEVRFDYGDHDGIISILKPLVGKSGWLTLSSFTVESLDQAEDYLVIGAAMDNGTVLDEECAARLFTLPGQVVGPCLSLPSQFIASATKKRQAVIQRTISERNTRFFDTESEKLDSWADDLKIGLEREIDDLDRRLKATRRAIRCAQGLQEKLAAQKEIQALYTQRGQKRRSLFDAQDKVEEEREQLIATIEGKLAQKSELRQLFTIRWVLA
jgi:adenine-specific DNA-methyltransferase